MEGKNKNEKITINDKILQVGVLSDGKGYQMYICPGMTLQEVAFNVMVIIRLLEESGHLKDKKQFDKMVTGYYTDPQYKPLKEV